MKDRTATLTRETGETQISVEINVDGKGDYDLNIGNGMFEHLLAQLSRHGLIDLQMKVTGDTQTGWHHIVEDSAIVLGRALRLAVGEGVGITRMAHAYVPLDEALALSVVDFSGRGYCVIEAQIEGSDLNDLPANLIHHFLESMAREAGFNLHIRLLSGTNNHHKAEAIFKSLARALRASLSIDARRSETIPSTKGTIS